MALKIIVMQSFTTKNGSHLQVWHDGYLRLVTKNGLVYCGYLIGSDTSDCSSPLGRMLLKRAYIEFKNVLIIN